MIRVRKQPDVRRNEILDVALALFTEIGFMHVTINDIAKKAGSRYIGVKENYHLLVR